jgi:glyoxylase-like metal-dependent hydrolase (beta-lactamase superfamily II)
MRRLVLGALIAAGAITMTVRAAQQPAGQPAPMVVEVEKLRDNFYVMRGGGGNSGVFLTAAGVVVVDTKNPGWGKPLLDKIRTVTDKPIKTIINTHTHGDHVSGNVEFPTVEVVTHENTAKNMETMKTPSGIAPPPGGATNIFKENSGRNMPKKTFKGKMTLGSGEDRIELRYFGRGHTNGDAWVFFPALKIVQTGDIFSGKNIPLLDAINGGSGLEIGKSLENAYKNLNGADTIITGHNPNMKPADLLEYAEFNKEFAATMQAAKKAGKTVDEMAASWKIPAKYQGYAEPAAVRLKSNIQVVFDETK